MRPWIWLVLIALAFLALRVPGLELPLHQDEYKWPMIVNPATNYGTNIPHPPLSQFIYQTGGAIVGYDVHLRFIPLTFGFANLFLLWYWLRMRAGERAALWAAGLFALSYYSILASLMVDTDGQIMPFFLLLALIAYERARSDPRWFAAVGLACVMGFLVKTSFILVIGALAADMLWERRAELVSRRVLIYAWWGGAMAAALAATLAVTQYLFPFFNLATSLAYWQHFVSLDHNWFQVAIQAAKAAFYLSPLLVLLPLWGTREVFERVRPLVFLVLFGLLFYLVIFDFSVGALDRYLQFLIIPLVSFAAVYLAQQVALARYRVFALVGCVAALGIFALQFAPHAVPSLYPKAAWIGRILSLRWDMLYPFSGGSGPLTFYVSFLVIGISWLLSAATVMLGWWRPMLRPALLLVLLPVAFAYSMIFTEEYLFGKVNGHAPGLVARAAAHIAADPAITRVVVYNDNGGDEVRKTGKYEKRLYTSPDFDWRDKARTMNAFSGHYLVIDTPPVDPASMFAAYFATCIPVYQDTDRYMHATIYDCRQAPPIVL